MDILLVGGAGGLGCAISAYLAERRYRVFSCDIGSAHCTHENVVALKTDITDSASIQETFETVSGMSERLDAVISIAGVYVMDSLIEIPEEKLAHIIDVNVMGVYRINKAFLPLLRKDGRIIITTSELAGQKPLPFNGIYAMTKTALQCYADSLRLELQLLGIKVVTVKPGAFDTNMVSSTQNQAKQMCENTKLYKMGTKRFMSIMQSKTGTAKDPKELGKVFYKALTAKRPRMTYYKNAGLGLKMYSALPRRLQAFAIRRILKG